MIQELDDCNPQDHLVAALGIVVHSPQSSLGGKSLCMSPLQLKSFDQSSILGEPVTQAFEYFSLIMQTKEGRTWIYMYIRSREFELKVAGKRNSELRNPDLEHYFIDTQENALR